MPGSRFDEVVAGRLAEFAAVSDRPADATGITLSYLERRDAEDSITYPYLRIEIDRELRTARLLMEGPKAPPPPDAPAVVAQGDSFWPLALTRALDDALLHLRMNEPELATLIFTTEGDPDLVADYDSFLLDHSDHWLVREVILYIKRTFKRIDVTSRTTLALVEPGGCFVGFLAEPVFASDRSYMLEGPVDPPEAEPRIRLTKMNLGPLPMGNGLTRLATRFWGRDEALEAVAGLVGKDLDATEAEAAGLVTFALDEIDWDDEIRILLEERASFSPDSLTGMEANLRFVGPETVETKIFGRLSAWQNWVFQRPNASGERGALRSYGTGQRPEFNRERV